MSEDIIDKEEQNDENTPVAENQHSDYKPADTKNESVKHQLSGMYQNWFLDYASYVILERAVPHINDGLKPVQRRILHSMKRLDDGRYNKVANIVGHTMQFHPHGDASIGDALVQLGQKDLLIDCQGNWGNILTGDGAAAPRYIEARLSKFALDVVFNPKTTEWQSSYDGRNKEPITLPVKFPLLLAQGVEGIAVGLSSKILPHNFNDLCNASIAYLRKEEFKLYPDFQTGGSIDVSRYNDGERGGVVKVRAKINKLDNKTLAITEIPYGKTTSSLIESILKAVEKGKIKVRKVDDNTAEKVEILVGGLTAAYYLSLKGHRVTVVDAMPQMGGMLRYGIPEYRLPKRVLDEEVAEIASLGVEMKNNFRIGRDVTFEEFKNSYDAVVLAIGAWESMPIGCPGEELDGVMGGIDFLRQVAMGEKPAIGDQVAVVGGGNTAMDACRTAVRLGAKEVYVVYRRTEAEMPAEQLEIDEAREEGVIYKFLTNPLFCVYRHKEQIGYIYYTKVC